MEKKEATGLTTKPETAPAPVGRPGLPAILRPGRGAMALAVVSAAGLLIFLWSNAVIGAVVAVFGLFSGAVFFVARRLARKSVSDGASAVPAGFPPGVSEDDFRSLKKNIGRLRFEEGMEELGERAHDQLLSSAERFKRFTSLLSEKFDIGEITYSRYHSAGTQAYLSILDNLRSAASILGAVGAINAEYAEKRLKTPETDATPAEERGALEERLKNKERQLARVQDILSANETALTAFDRINEAISLLKTSSGWSSGEMEGTLKELERLAERVPKYSI